MQIAILGGSGRLGLWYARRFAAAGHAVTITGRNRAKLERAAREAGVGASTDNRASIRGAEIVVVSTPIETAPDMIRAVAESAEPGALITDLTSVKAGVIEAYRTIERADLELVSLHPLHGPRLSNLQNVTVLALPIKAGCRYEHLRRYLASEGALIVELEAAQHDREMAILQGLTHFVAITAARALTELRPPSFETPAYALLRATMARVVLQDPALYAAIQLENPESIEVRRAFLRTAERICQLAEQRNQLALQQEIETSACAFGDAARELSDTDACLATLAARKPPVESMSVATLGPPGTFSDMAVRQYAQARGLPLSPLYYRTIPEVFEAVKRNEAAFGVVPVENMIDGTIVVTLDGLFGTGLRVVAELLVPIHHALSVAAGTRIEAIRRVLSIGPVLGQTRRWLRANLPNAKLVETNSSAEAIDQVARLRIEGDAAIGLASTAEAAGLEVLERDIEDEKGNVTRFFVISTQDAPRTGHDRTTLCIHDVPNRPGVLDHILQVMSRHGLNLSKIESRPTRRKLGEYQFYMDVEGHQEDQGLKDAISDLNAQSRVTVLGSYPRSF